MHMLRVTAWPALPRPTTCILDARAAALSTQAGHYKFQWLDYTVLSPTAGKHRPHSKQHFLLGHQHKMPHVHTPTCAPTHLVSCLQAPAKLQHSHACLLPCLTPILGVGPAAFARFQIALPLQPLPTLRSGLLINTASGSSCCSLFPTRSWFICCGEAAQQMHNMYGVSEMHSNITIHVPYIAGGTRYL
jgi:hypothetical protein